MPGGVGPSEREKTADGVGEAPPCGSNGLRGTGENGVERGSRGRLGAGFDLKKPGARRALPRRASWRRLLQRQARAVAEPRGEEDGLTRGVGLSAVGRGKQARDAGPAVAWPSWARARGWAERLAGRAGKRGGTLGWGWCWAAEGKACGPKLRKGGNGRKFPFSFYK
jgi:hypothetical protein